MDCRPVLRTRWLAGMTAVLGLSLISLNLAPRGACAQEDPDYPVTVTIHGAPVTFIARAGRATFDPSIFNDNANAAATTNADQLWPGLTGDGVTVGIWDEGDVRATHQELTARVTFVQGVVGIRDHSTHVAGTIGATGVDPAARGMASSVLLHSWDRLNDAAEMALDAAVIDISNHSYGYPRGWTDKKSWPWIAGMVDTWLADYEAGIVEDPNFGKYRATNDAVDQSLYGTPPFSDTWGLDEVLYDNPNLLAVFSAGNERNDIFNNRQGVFHNHQGDDTFVAYFPSGPAGPDWYQVTGPIPAPDGGAAGYDTLSNNKVPKNTLVVGSVLDHTTDPHDPATISLSGFSSYGPTDDGRVKPDVVANGDQVYSSIGSGDADYGEKWGTSMASPNAAGTAALLLEHYREVKEVTDVASATLKGLIIHTATDAGNPGPDYSYGYGLVNAAAAADFISDTEGINLIIQNAYIRREQTIPLPSDGGDLIKVTLAWTDPAPDTLPGGGLDDDTSVLVNDLDLWLTGPGGTFYPWTLDRNNPSLNAVQTGLNGVDNVEQVWIENPGPGPYTIHVGGTLDGAYLWQSYSLLASVSEANQWDLDGAGSYNDSANWTNNRVPDGVNAGANFLGAIEEDSEVTVDAPVTVGTINFDNADYDYELAGPAAITLETSGGDAQINVENGDHTISARLSIPGGLTVDTADATALSLSPASGNSVVQGNLTKDGPGSLVLGSRLMVAGELDYNGGDLEIASGVLVMPGGDVNIGAGLNLVVSGDVNRRVTGADDSRITVGGPTSIGVLGDTDGYNFAGLLDVGPHSVGLVDADLAHLGGAKLVTPDPLPPEEGGTLSSFAGIRVLPFSPPNLDTAVTGEGHIIGLVVGSFDDPEVHPALFLGSGDGIKITGVLRGRTTTVNVDLSDCLFQPGFSPVFSRIGSPATMGSTLIQIEGPTHGKVIDPDLVSGLIPGDYTQFYAFRGRDRFTIEDLDPEIKVVGPFKLDLTANYVPAAGTEFLLIQTGPLRYPDGSLLDPAILTYDGVPTLDTALAPLPRGMDWVVSEYSEKAFMVKAVRDIVTAVPEPGTLVMLGTGGLGLLLLVWRRRKPEA